ncbi:MAG: hypothetical protein QM657_07825 [Lacrimispora sp.]|uniref:hypothetical protein n=1 Tax=Lacrimispora sp. TaxID=2719234 RepID=UPI0039E42B56
MNHYNNQSRSNRRKTGSGYKKGSGRSSFLTILLFYVLPFLVINGLIFLLVTSRPKGEVMISESKDYISTTMELRISSLLPITSMEMALDGTPVEATKTGSKSYTAVLTNNGVLEIKLTSLNQMKNILYEQVNVLDDTPPSMKEIRFDEGVLSFFLEDTQSGVDFSSIYASDEDNPDILPLSIDRSTGLITFEIKKENLTVNAKDKIGNEMHKTFTPEGESVEDSEEETETAAEAETATEAETAKAQ